MNAKSEIMNVGIVLFEGFELLDVYGLIEMLSGGGESFRFLMLADEAGSVKSAQGPKGMSDMALSDCIGVDILIVPGG